MAVSLGVDPNDNSCWDCLGLESRPAVVVVVHTLTSSGGFLVVGVLSSAKWGTGSDKGTVTVAAAMPSAGEEISKQVHQVIDTLPFGSTLFRNEQLITPPG